MSICQRYLSKFFIFFSSLFIVFLLLMESNIGFKYVFNFANYYFLGLKTEKISGNWRNFTLKNIHFDNLRFSIQAKSMHIIIDTRSFFKISTIFKEIEIEDLIILLKKNKSVLLNNSISDDSFQKNIFFKNPIFVKKIRSNKILLKTEQGNICLSNFFSSINLKNNKITIFSTYIKTISIDSIYFNIKNTNNKFIVKNNLSHIEKIHSILHFFSEKSGNFIPFNVNLKFLKCKKLTFFNYENLSLSNIELMAQLKKDILKIKKIKICSPLLQMQSYGKIIFKKEFSTLFFFKSKILISSFHNKKINILFKGKINNHIKFTVEFNNLFKCNINGVLLLDLLDYPFNIQLNSKHLFFSKNKNLILNLYNLHAALKGNINNYSLSLKNIFSIKNTPSILMNIKARGNLKNVFLESIHFSPVVNNKINNSGVKLNQYISDIMGDINILSQFNKNHNNLSISKINLHGHIMKKKMSLLGSFYYRDFNFLRIPGIEFFFGKNKAYLKGSLGNRLNIQSSIYANNLSFFVPNLKGRIKAISNIYGLYFFPILRSKILGNYLHWKNICLKKIDIRTNMHIKNKFSGYFFAHAEKIRVSRFHIGFINFKSYWTNKKQKIHFSLKSQKFNIKLTLNGAFDDQTGNWFGIFKKMNICTFWSCWASKNTPLVNCNINRQIDHFSNHFIKRKNIFSKIIGKIKKYCFDIINRSPINFKSKFFINAQLKSISGNTISSGKIFLRANHIKLERIKNETIFHEKIDRLKLFMNFKENTIQTQLIVEDFKNLLEKNVLFGHLNITDIYKQKRLHGKFTASHFPFSFVNFFITNFKKVNGIFDGSIKFYGTLYQPKISADVSFQNIFIKSNDLLKYMTLFFHSFFKKAENLKINQAVIMKKGNILFTLDSTDFIFNKNSNLQWNLIFNSKKIIVEIFPKIKLNFSSQLTLHYLFKKYSLVGYINFYFFYFKIDEKDFLL